MSVLPSKSVRRLGERRGDSDVNICNDSSVKESLDSLLLAVSVVRVESAHGRWEHNLATYMPLLITDRREDPITRRYRTSGMDDA